MDNLEDKIMDILENEDIDEEEKHKLLEDFYKKECKLELMKTIRCLVYCLTIIGSLYVYCEYVIPFLIKK